MVSLKNTFFSRRTLTTTTKKHPSQPKLPPKIYLNMQFVLFMCLTNKTAKIYTAQHLKLQNISFWRLFATSVTLFILLISHKLSLCSVEEWCLDNLFSRNWKKIEIISDNGTTIVHNQLTSAQQINNWPNVEIIRTRLNPV